MLRVLFKYRNADTQKVEYDECEMSEEEATVLLNTSHAVFKYHTSPTSYRWTRGDIVSSTFIKETSQTVLTIEVDDLEPYDIEQ